MHPAPDRSPSPAAVHWQLAMSLAIAGAVLGWLLWHPPVPSAALRGELDEPVRVAGPARLFVDPSSPLAARLQVVLAQPTSVEQPELHATGRVLATLAVADGPHFASVELAGLYADWQRARLEHEFCVEQLRLVADLAAARDAAREQAVARLEQLVETGSESQRELAAARADRAELQLEGRRQTQEIANALAIARRNEAVLEQRLQLLGVTPSMLQPDELPAPIALAVAEVPEARSQRVRPGMHCQVRFLALDDRWLPAVVSALAPGIAEDRRVLPVQFTLHDPDRAIRPGMFAEVRLGTEPREAVLLPAAGLLRLGHADYVFVADGDGHWRAVGVQTGAVVGDRIEIRAGIAAGDRVLGEHAVLLRPLLAPALALAADGGR